MKFMYHFEDAISERRAVLSSHFPHLKPEYRLLLCVAGTMSLRLNDILQYFRLKST